MSTNFYVEFNRCESCGRYDRRHIGKRSGGWQFTFRGYEGEIGSFSDWLRYLRGHADAVVVDEYGKHLTVAQFLYEVKQTEGLLVGATYDGAIIDPEGYMVVYREFF